MAEVTPGSSGRDPDDQADQRLMEEDPPYLRVPPLGAGWSAGTYAPGHVPLPFGNVTMRVTAGKSDKR